MKDGGLKSRGLVCSASEGRVEKAARPGQARFATVAVAPVSNNTRVAEECSLKPGKQTTDFYEIRPKDKTMNLIFIMNIFSNRSHIK